MSMNMLHIYSRYYSKGFETYSIRPEDLDRLEKLSNIGKFSMISFVVDQELGDNGAVVTDFVKFRLFCFHKILLSKQTTSLSVVLFYHE